MAGVVYKHTAGNIISMIILNLEVIDLNGAFEDFVLNLFNNDILSVYQDKVALITQNAVQKECCRIPSDHRLASGVCH